MARPFAFLAIASFLLASGAVGAQGASQPAVDSLFQTPIDGPVDAMPKASAAEAMKRHRQAAIAARQHATDQDIERLSAALDAGMYPEVAAFVRAHSGEPKILQWTLGRASRGDVPMMWELADLYAQDGVQEPAVKWAYAAIIGALQERSLCLQKSNVGPSKIAAEHPKVVAIARAHPHLTREAKAAAMSFLASPLNYPSPEAWLCKPYNVKSRLRRAPSSPSVYDAAYFPVLRARARNKLRLELEIPGAPEQEPAMPAAPARQPAASSRPRR
jgi:hypothetical protein